MQDGVMHQAEFERIFKTFLTAEELTATSKQEVEAEVRHEDDALQRAGRRYACRLAAHFTPKDSRHQFYHQHAPDVFLSQDHSLNLCIEASGMR